MKAKKAYFQVGRQNSARCGRFDAAHKVSMNIPLVHVMLCNSQRHYMSYYEIHYFELHNPKTTFISQPIASVLLCRKLVYTSYSLTSTQEIYGPHFHFMFGKK